MDNDWLTLEETATALSITVQGVRNLCQPHHDHGLVGRKTLTICGRQQHPRWMWSHVTRASVQAYLEWRDTSEDRRKLAQQMTFATRAGRKMDKKPCPRCTILTDDGALCRLCWEELARARYRAITGRSLIKPRTVGCQVDAWRVGRLVVP